MVLQLGNAVLETSRCLAFWKGYTLALRRNLSHVGARVAAEMIAGGDDQGNLRDKKVVLVYEHRAAMAKRIRNKHIIAEALGEGAEVWMVVNYRGDGTQQEAIDKEKVHNSIIINLSTRPMESPSVEDLSKNVVRTHQAGDLQVQKATTGEETYQIVKRQFASVHCPFVDGHLYAPPDRISCYLFCLDNGPDNVGMIRRLRLCIATAPNTVMFGVVWCVHHQTHLMVARVGVTKIRLGPSPYTPHPKLPWAQPSPRASNWRCKSGFRHESCRASQPGRGQNMPLCYPTPVAPRPPAPRPQTCPRRSCLPARTLGQGLLDLR